jgi:hypothetical protein
MRWSPNGRSIAYIVAPSREDDPKAGIWVDDFKNPPREILRGWVDWWLARGPHDEIYFVKASPDLKGELWKIGWNGQGLSRTFITIPVTQSYSSIPGRTSPTYSSFAISPTDAMWRLRRRQSSRRISACRKAGSRFRVVKQDFGGGWEQMSVGKGTKLGSYEITGAIGSRETRGL